MLKRATILSFINLRTVHHLPTSSSAVGSAASLPILPPKGSKTTITPVNETHLLSVCTILYQQQHSPDTKLHKSLSKTPFDLTHEFFLQICNKFPLSWKPVYKFHSFTQTQPHFTHSSTTFNKMLDVVGKARNIDLFWELIQESGKLRLVNIKTFIIGLKTLASARELRKCVELFHLMDEFGYGYNLDTLNKVVEALCKSKLVDEAKHLVFRLKNSVRPDGTTYKWLMYGFCDVGDLIEASRIWNLMVEEGFEPDIDAVETMLEMLFKHNKFDEAMKFFQSIKVNRYDDMGVSTYRVVINWLNKKGKLEWCYLMFEEMQKRGIRADNLTLASMVYGLVNKGRIREAYGIVGAMEKPDINVYNRMIKGLLSLKRAKDATRVFREMINRGCEPTMHTYIMLLQGHLGKRGRKGSDPLVNFDSIFVGGLVKTGKLLEATKFVERAMNGKAEVPRFDYNKFLHYYSNEEGVIMFESMSKKLREVGSFDLADIFARYAEKMATRDRRRNRMVEP